MANSRAKAVDETDGFVKLLRSTENDALLGAHIIGSGASELIAQVNLGINVPDFCKKLSKTCHGHPTLSESILESCLATYKRAIHM